MKHWLLKVLVGGLDMGANVFFGGYPDETISSRAATARNHDKAWGCYLCRVLDWLEPSHCDLAIAGDIARAEAALHDLENP